MDSLKWGEGSASQWRGVTSVGGEVRDLFVPYLVDDLASLASLCPLPFLKGLWARVASVSDVETLSLSSTLISLTLRFSPPEPVATVSSLLLSSVCSLKQLHTLEVKNFPFQSKSFVLPFV